MNLYPDKKHKEGLVEVLYATMDGNVYFLDIDDGSYTRDILSLGLPFKGAGAMDPRGIPMMWCGAGTPPGGLWPHRLRQSLYLQPH